MISVYNIVHVFMAKSLRDNYLFHNKYHIREYKQWRFEFLLDTVLCFRFCPKDHRDKDRGRKGRMKGEHFLQPPANAG